MDERTYRLREKAIDQLNMNQHAIATKAIEQIASVAWDSFHVSQQQIRKMTAETDAGGCAFYEQKPDAPDLRTADDIHDEDS